MQKIQIVNAGMDKLIEHKQYTNKYAEALPDIRNWKWGVTKPGRPL
jgi:phosphoketolase